MPDKLIENSQEPNMTTTKYLSILVALLLFLGCGPSAPPTLNNVGGYVLTFAVADNGEELTAAEIESHAVARLQEYCGVAGATATLRDDQLIVVLPGVDEQTLQLCQKNMLIPAQLSFQVVADPLIDPLFYNAPAEPDQRQVKTPAGRTAIWTPKYRADDEFAPTTTREIGGETCYLLLQTPSDLQGTDFLSFEKTFDADIGGLALEFHTTPNGEKRMKGITAANMGRDLAIVFGNRIVMMPTIRGSIGERGVISGRFSEEEIDELVTLGELSKHGQLPQLRLLSQEKIDPK
ncbi:hypothetical protein C5Y93_23370 [Blastopirellula marina]|uniref:SecDF P1 head subdomain domain-containing protein n=2 Tax=Blastopirellula marina TaxID=124 RepID=A0A2S8GGK0_9BACT|nr:hypothetical protein C5Y93_23370 [Blastopirellula marina]